MRIPPALLTQREFRQAHGDKICAELDLNKLGFIVINYRDGIYWVLDGQHRVYAMLKFGFAASDPVECEVYENLTDQEAAEIFLGRDSRKAIGLYDKFFVAVTAGRRREMDTIRAIESSGLKVGRTKEENTIGAIGACLKVYDRSGEIVLGQSVRALKNAFGGDPAGFAPEMIQGVGHLFNRYNGRTNEHDLAQRLSAVPRGVRGILQRAELQRAKTGAHRDVCVAATIVEVYNKGLVSKQKRLPSWWKDEPESA